MKNLRNGLLATVLVLSSGSATLGVTLGVEPEIVTSYFGRNDVGDNRNTTEVYAENTKGKMLWLLCQNSDENCRVPEKDVQYFLFRRGTEYQLPRAKNPLTYDFLVQLHGSYNRNDAEDVFLVIVNERDRNSKLSLLGPYVYNPKLSTPEYWNQRYLIQDGPIVYGRGMSFEGKKKAWQNFFMSMMKAIVDQKGKDALGPMLTPRCGMSKDDDSCVSYFQANLVGVGRSKEPREVLLLVSSDPKDRNIIRSRIVCTRPGTVRLQVCRDWETGELVGIND